ncbi:MAG: hypothetical protein M3401_19165 [Actinomycetota bacterium]|nr:hypothetical protein [Actinomycetota bacterium]
MSALVFDASALRFAKTTAISRRQARDQLEQFRATGLMVHGVSFTDMAGRRVLLIDIRRYADRLIPEVRMFELTENAPLEQLPVRRISLRLPLKALHAEQIAFARSWITAVLGPLEPSARELDNVTRDYARRITFEGPRTVSDLSLTRALLEMRRLRSAAVALKPNVEPSSSSDLPSLNPEGLAAAEGGAYAHRL